MAKRDMKKALGASLQAEEQAVRSRFDKAETILGKKDAVPRKDEKSNTARVIRDSFTMPAVDYELISELRTRCMKAGVGITKSELLRAGLNALGSMTDKELVKVIEKLEKVRTGRPATD